jgi:hypothetical protein
MISNATVRRPRRRPTLGKAIAGFSSSILVLIVIVVLGSLAAAARESAQLFLVQGPFVLLAGTVAFSLYYLIAHRPFMDWSERFQMPDARELLETDRGHRCSTSARSDRRKRFHS